MNKQEFRVIPRYEGYGVTQNGIVKSLERDLILSRYLLNGYLIVDAFRGAYTETLPVHRAVALAWVVNPDLNKYTVVNHKDGETLNNWYENLEWTDHSGNNYHAVNTGLRSDNINCLVRDFFTKQVYEFSSMAQAAEFMGLPKDSTVIRLRPKKFGALVAGRYEFRYANEENPWFYQNRPNLVPPSRFMVVVQDATGQMEEIYSTAALLKKYQLYGAYSKAIPALVADASEFYPDKVFTLRDSYMEEQFRVMRQTRKSVAMPILAKNWDGQTRDFSSLTECAKCFNVDRSSIIGRLSNGKNLDGWTFSQLPL